MGDKKKKTPERRVALYRKYRSKSLDEIIGQEHITKTLANAIKQGKISHAYLFTGPRGTGKTSIARILAHEINDLPYTDDATHLDIIEIDAASNRRIDDIRELREKVHIAPIAGKYKVYIIDEVHMLTTESFNALLKTLEEPPAHVIFILATTEVHKLPATIISRTQRHTFKSIPVKQVSEHLASIAKDEDIQITPEALELLARHGNGSFRDSISLLDQLSTHESEVTAEVVELLLGIAPTTQLKSLLTSVTKGDTKQVLDSVEQLLESGLTPSGIATQLATLIRDGLKEDSDTAIFIPLLDKLLLVHSAIYQKLMLESTLLQACTPNHTASTSAPAVIQNPEPVPQPKMPTPKPPAEPAAIQTKPTKQITTPSLAQKKTLKTTIDFNISDIWPDILATIKSKNNPLYTVLRLAHPSISENSLLLTFSFPFHQKRVDDVKNKIIIAAAVQDITEVTVEIFTKLDKTLPPPEHINIEQPVPAPDPAHASVIDSVRDIMGGGEVVNV